VEWLREGVEWLREGVEWGVKVWNGAWRCGMAAWRCGMGCEGVEWLCEGVEWLRPAQDRVLWQTSVDIVMKISGFVRGRVVCEQLSDCQLGLSFVLLCSRLMICSQSSLRAVVSSCCRRVTYRGK
jgi:hypothetical protein